MSMIQGFAPKVILCPVDFSGRSVLALRYAAAVAREFRSNLIVLHAETFEPPRYFTADGASGLIAEHAKTRQVAQEYLQEHVRTSLGRGAVPFRSILAEQHPVDAILHVADEERADLVVMGTHARSGAQRVWLGSVTENVFRHATVPVLVVRQHEADFIDPGRPEIAPKLMRILCPVNFSETAHVALQHAVALAQRFGASLTLLYSQEHDGAPARTRDDLCAWVPDELAAQCSMEPLIRSGHAAEQIVAHARTEHDDLIVIGAEHRPFLEATFIGSTTDLVVRHAPAPVLVVPRIPAA